MKSLFLKTRNICGVLTTVFALFSVCGFAQLAMPRVDKIGAERGLELENEVAQIKIDSQGILWIVSFSEIIRFDGTKFFKLIDSEINHGSFFRFSESPDGERYILDLHGLMYRIEGDTLRESDYTTRLQALEHSVRISDIEFDSLNQLHLNFHGFSTLTIADGATRRIDLQMSRAHHSLILIHQPSGPPLQIYLCNGNKALAPRFYVMDAELNLLDSVTLEVDSLLMLRFRKVDKLASGNFLVALSNGVLLEVSEDKVVAHRTFDGELLGFLIDSYGKLWLNLKGNGSYVFEANHYFDLESSQHFFPATDRIIAAEDAEGGLWCYSELEGVFRINDPAITYYSSKSIPEIEDRVDALVFMKDTLVFGQPSHHLGKLSIPDETFQLEQIPLSPNLKRLKMVRKNITGVYYDQENDRPWISNRTDVLYKSEGQWKLIDQQNPAIKRPEIQSYVVMPNNHTDASAIATHNSQFFVCQDTSISFVSKDFSCKIHAVMAVGDSIFVDTEEGLFLQHHGKLTKYKKPVATNKEAFFSWEYWDDLLWVSGKKTGVFVLEGDSLKPITHQSRQILAVNFAKRSNDELWLLSPQGSFLVQKSAADTYQFIPHSPLPSDYYTGIVSNATSLFAGTKRHGILRVDFEHLKRYPLKPSILNLLKVQVGDKYQAVAENTFETSYKENSIRVWFGSQNYSNNQLTYRYRLKQDQDVSWTMSKEGYAQYSNLAPGDYTLEMQVQKGKQGYSDSHTLLLSVSPPLWRTWWFLLSFGLLIAFAIDRIITIRVKVANREKALTISSLVAEQNALRAKMDPHFMFNVIASIQYLVDEGSKKRTNHFLDLFSKSLRNILARSNDKYLMIKDELKFLDEYIQMERFRLEERFDYSFESRLTEAQLEALIPPFLIQPLVENAIQHGLKNKKGLGVLEIILDVKSDRLQIVIQDNGIGRERAALHPKNQMEQDSYGIEIIRKRLALHNGKPHNLTLTDLYTSNKVAKGTKVALEILMLKNQTK